MNPKHLPHLNSSGGSAVGLVLLPEGLPLTVRESAVYLGVSVQTVYLRVERKQIPHLRGMGRNKASENACSPEITIPCRPYGEGMILVLGNGRIHIWKIFPSRRSARRRPTGSMSAR